MGYDRPSPRAELTLHLFRSIKVLGAPGPARVIEKVNDCPLSPARSDPGGHGPSELVQHPQMTGKGRVVVSAMSTKQDGGRGLREINIAQ